MSVIRVALALALVALAGCGGGADDPPSREIEAVFDERLPPMRAGDSVRVGGVEIGKVSAVRREGEETVLVLRRTVEGGWPIAPSVEAEIRPRIFEKDRYFVDLVSPASAGTGVRDGDRIPPDRTSYDGTTADDVMGQLDDVDRDELEKFLREYADDARPPK